MPAPSEARSGAPAQTDWPIVEIVRREEFSAAHRLANDRLSEEENQRLFGPCYGTHGHNYVLEVYVRGRVNPKTGMVMNLADLMSLLREKIILEVDHKNLSTDVPFLQGFVTTAENIAIAFWGRLQDEIEAFEGCRLHRIRLYESPSNFVDYLGPEPPAPSRSSASS